MKKVIMLLATLCLASGVYAACWGPFCYDDSNATINGVVVSDVPLSSTTITALIPSAGQRQVCNTCANGGSNLYAVCLATAARVNSFVIASTTTVKCQ